MIPKIILERPKIIVDTRCPKCKSMDIAAMPIVETQCKNCKTNFTAEVPVNLFFTVAKKLEQLLGYHNAVIIQGERDNSHNINGADLLQPKSKWEDDVYHTLLAIKKCKENQQCWEVTELESTTDVNDKRYCKDCGYCNECVACAKCKQTYKPKVVKTRLGVEKRYKCPSCGAKEYSKTYVKDGSCKCGCLDILRNKFDAANKTCPKCGSKNITEPEKINVYRVTISRQKRYWIEDKE